MSTRTIQRIEKGQNQPMGDTLRKLSKALNLPIQDLTIQKKLKNKIQVLHMLPIFGLVMPFGNVLAPFIFLLYNREDKAVLSLGKNIIFWQILISLILGSLYLGGLLSKLAHVEIPVFSTDIISLAIFSNLIILGFIPLIQALIIEYKGVIQFYPPVFK